jgi:hypothetical protein
MYARPTAPLTIGGVIDDAIRLYRESFSRCWIPALLLALMGGLLALWLTAPALDSVNRGNPAELMRFYGQPRIYGLYLIQTVLNAALYGALFLAQDGATGGAVHSLGDAFGGGFARIGGAVLAVILFGLIVGVGFVLLLLPGFYFLGALCLWPVALYIDGAGAIESLRVSRALTRGYWWRTSAILTVAFIIILVFSTVIGLLAGVTVAVSRFRTDPTPGLIGIQIITMIANVFIFPMYSAILLSTYRDLKLRREGGDLADRLGALPAG